MMQKFMLGAYWDARQEGLAECTEKAVRFFAGLAKIDPLLTQWYERGGSRKEALERRVDIHNERTLEELLLNGRNRRDIGKEVIEELGFRISLWNGGADEQAAASLSIHCGSYSSRVGNNVVLNLPYGPESLAWVGKASSLLALVAQIWQPKWAGIMSKKAMRERGFDGDHPFVDWMVYVPRSIEPVPQPGYVESLDGLGSIVIVQPSPPGERGSDLSHIHQVERLLID